MLSLEGIKVLDFTHFIAGPSCTQTLADHGAEVIKVEPLQGEASRVAYPMYEDDSIYFASFNRNKRSMSIDMKSTQGKQIVKYLLKSTDILVTNYAVGVPEKLGIDYDTISEINPKLIMVHITGFGLTGKKRKDSAFDGIIQAMSGIAHLTGESDGKPMKAGLFIADHIAGKQGVIGALLALQSRSVTGKGQLVDVSMLDSTVSMLAYNLSLVSVFNEKPRRSGNRSTNVFATTFPTKDGYVYIAPIAEKMWKELCVLIKKPEWANEDSVYNTVNGKLDNYDKLESEITKWTKSKSTSELISILSEKRIACGKVNSIEEVMNDEQIQHRDMLANLDFKGIDITVPGTVVKMSGENNFKHSNAPSIGEHTEEVLLEFGYSERDIKSLEKNKVIRTEKK